MTIPTESYGVDWVVGRRLAELTGLTVKALDRKRERGVWQAGVHYRMMDGGIYYSISAYNAWAAGRNSPGSSATAPRYVSRSRSTASAAASR
jgi:hypothetical protein